MPTKRAVLAELTAEELRANVDYYELEVADRRVKAQLLDALAGSRSARLDEILGDLYRDRLKELCRAFGLDDSGRKKVDLIARLVAPIGATRSDAAEPSTPSRSAGDAASPSEEVLSVAQLEQYLRSAADILRGSIDSSDYKTYIFGLLFLKRLSDRFEEEAEKLIAEGVSETVAWTDPDEHQFFVPDRARWGRIQRTATKHRRGAEQGVRGAGGAKQRAGGCSRRHHLPMHTFRRAARGSRRACRWRCWCTSRTSSRSWRFSAVIATQTVSTEDVSLKLNVDAHARLDEWSHGISQKGITVVSCVVHPERAYDPPPDILDDGFSVSVLLDDVQRQMRSRIKRD